MFNKNKFFVAALVFCAASVVAQAQKVQTVFSLEEEVRKEVAVPMDVMAILKSDRRVDGCFQQKGEGASEAAWFAASEIDLNGDRRMDLIIKAKDACLFGANQGPFWVFQKMPDGYQQVLSANGLGLAVMPKKVNSFNQIEISKVAAQKPAIKVYSFKAGKYQ